MENADLRSLEEKIHRNYWSDGLIDIFTGFAIVLIGTSWLIDLVPLGAAAPALLIPLWPLARNRITVPRAGRVAFSDERLSRMKTAWIGSIALGSGFFLAGVGLFAAHLVFDLSFESMIGDVIAGLPTLLLGLAMAMGGLVLGQLRGFVYAVVFLLVAVSGILAALHPGWMILGAGLIVLSTGLLMIARFMLRYSIEDESVTEWR